ncbi:MAG: hypothetical protein ABUL60_14865 [Myxococcales bacterium]
MTAAERKELRDRFAVAALAGLALGREGAEPVARNVAKYAYEVADAMLAERERRPVRK